MKLVKNLVVVVGKYTAQDGTEKNRYQTIGKMFKRDDGTFTIKLDVLPIGNEWTGWVNLFDIDDKAAAANAPEPKPKGKPKAKAESEDEEDDDLPF